MNCKELDDFVLQTIDSLGYHLSRSAYVIMLEEGILTEETDFLAYYIAKKMYDCCIDDKCSIRQKETYLRDCLPPETGKFIVQKYREFMETKEEGT